MKKIQIVTQSPKWIFTPNQNNQGRMIPLTPNPNTTSTIRGMPNKTSVNFKPIILSRNSLPLKKCRKYSTTKQTLSNNIVDFLSKNGWTTKNNAVMGPTFYIECYKNNLCYRFCEFGTITSDKTKMLNKIVQINTKDKVVFDDVNKVIIINDCVAIKV